MTRYEDRCPECGRTYQERQGGYQRRESAWTMLWILGGFFALWIIAVYFINVAG